MTRELWVRFLAGETLSDAEQAALVAALEADPELRAELLQDFQLDGSLRALGDARRSGAAFAAGVVDCLGPERDATRFIQKVEARLAELPPEPTSPKRDSRSNLPRVSRRFWRRTSENAGWRAAAAAAAIFLGIVLLATAFSSKTPAPVVKREPAPVEVVPPTPPVPTPELGPERREPVPAPPPSREPEPGPEKRDPEPLVVPAPKLADATPSNPERPPLTPSAAPTRSAEESKIARGPAFVEVVDQVYWSKDQKRVKKGEVLEYGQDVYSAGRGTATLRYDDGTSVELKPGTQLRDLSGSSGRHLEVLVGEVASDIHPQPAGQPMIFSTPHGKATILGTKIRLSVAKDASLGTTLNVDEGRVRFQRSSDGAAVEVEAGQVATASASLRELKPAKAFPPQFMIRFGPADVPKAPGVYLDSGEPFSPARGYGWDGTRDGDPVPNAKQPDGRQVVMGRGAEWKLDGKLKRDDPRSSVVVAGWGEHAEHWRMELPNGRYEVTVGVGDANFEQGPHHVAVEGKQIVNHVTTRPPKTPHAERTEVVEVKDGELNLRVGGYTAPLRSVDTSKDTLLHYLVIKRAPAK